jgi:hypothetical protein
MSATAEQLAQLRRMVVEPTSTTYSDALLEGFIEKHPMMDELNQEPYSWLQTGGIPTQVANEFWIPTYDLNAAAAEIWSEKASLLTTFTDFNADGGNYSDSQQYDQAMKQARFYLSRRSAMTIKQIKWPPERSGYNADL